MYSIKKNFFYNFVYFILLSSKLGRYFCRLLVYTHSNAVNTWHTLYISQYIACAFSPSSHPTIRGQYKVDGQPAVADMCCCRATSSVYCVVFRSSKDVEFRKRIGRAGYWGAITGPKGLAWVTRRRSARWIVGHRGGRTRRPSVVCANDVTRRLL